MSRCNLVGAGYSFEDLMLHREACYRSVSCTLLQVLAMSQIPLLQIWFHEKNFNATAAAESVAPVISELQTMLNNRILRLGNATRVSFYKTDLSTVEQLF